MALPLRFGILGAARIAPAALLVPARQGPEAKVEVVASRDRARAVRFAEAHGIARVASDYQAVVDDPEIDAVYNPLPQSLHLEWSVKALRAGKHVLCEKPFTANAREAREMVDVAEQLGLVLAEAFHYRYHPMFERILGIVHSGKLGTLRHVEGRFTTAIADPLDLRHQYETAGGATMDLGCYALHWLRHVVREEPRVVKATAVVGNPNIDLTMTANLEFPSGTTGTMHCSMASDQTFATSLEVVGDRGSLLASNPMAPHLGNELTTSIEGEENRERFETETTTYRYQLLAFVDAVQKGRLLPTGGEDAVLTMRLIDEVYRAAGLPVRGMPPV